MCDCAFGELGRTWVRKDVKSLEVGYAQGVREIDMDVEAKGAENALLSREESSSAPLVRAFRDIVCFCILLLQVGGVDESRREGTEIGEDVDDAAWGFWVCGEFGGEVE
jgi:hypothetical protein